MKLSQADTLRVARSVIRDMAHDWAIKELQAPPQDVCAALSEILGEKYDFESGIVMSTKRGKR